MLVRRACTPRNVRTELTQPVERGAASHRCPSTRPAGADAVLTAACATPVLSSAVSRLPLYRLKYWMGPRFPARPGIHRGMIELAGAAKKRAGTARSLW